MGGVVLDKLAGRVLRTRWLVRSPVWLYRHRLGALFGTRLLMLEHTGRRTGLPRYVVLETVSHPDPATFVVAAGFGERAQWYRNIRREPRVRVSVGRRHDVPAEAVELAGDERDGVLEGYARDHPRTWARLRATVENALGTPVQELPLVRLSLKNSG